MLATNKTHFRWFIISLLFILNFISYVDRSAIAYAVHELIQIFHFNAAEMGMILGGFGIGYLITTFFGGLMVDKWGPRPIILIFSLVWAAAIGFTGVIAGFASAYLARFCLGLGEGPNFPAVERVVSDWLPAQARGKALSNSLVAVPLSLAAGAPIVTILLSHAGWRAMFFVLAIIVVLVWPLYYFFLKNKPSESSHVNKAELDFITSGQSDSESAKASWKSLLKNKTILSNNWGFFVYGYSMFFYLTWLPDYLESSYHLNIKQVGLFSILPWLLGAFLLWCVGYLSDYIYSKTNRLRLARTYPIVISQFLMLLCLLPMIISHNLTLTLIFISLAVGFNMSNNTLFYSINIDVAKKQAATLLGIMNSGFAIAGFLAPVLTGFIVQATGHFSSAFILMAVLTLSSVVVILLFHKPE